MQDDPCLQDGLHTTRAQIAELLDERRVEVANSVVALLKSRNVDGISPLIVRTLVHALAKAMADSSPESPGSDLAASTIATSGSTRVGDRSRRRAIRSRSSQSSRTTARPRRLRTR